jgi:hypothetical protein
MIRIFGHVEAFHNITKAVCKDGAYTLTPKKIQGRALRSDCQITDALIFKPLREEKIVP